MASAASSDAPNVTPATQISDAAVGLRDFDILGALGYGGSSEVFLVQRQSQGGSLHAMKVIAKQALGPRAVKQVVAENAILQKVVHPYIVPLHYSFQDDHNFYLLFEYFGGGDLFHHLQARGPLATASAQILAAEVILALDYLHTVHSVIYRDLKPENVLLSLDGHAVLADFGSARWLASTSRIGSRTIVGTPVYMAPEVFLGGGYGVAVDWWALGILVHEMLTGELPELAQAGRLTDMESEMEAMFGAAPAPATLHHATDAAGGATRPLTSAASAPPGRPNLPRISDMESEMDDMFFDMATHAANPPATDSTTGSITGTGLDSGLDSPAAADSAAADSAAAEVASQHINPAAALAAQARAIAAHARPVASGAQDLMDGLLQRQPSKRLGSGPGGAEEIRSHPFFISVDWPALTRRQVDSPLAEAMPGQAPPRGGQDGGRADREAESAPDGDGPAPALEGAFEPFNFAASSPALPASSPALPAANADAGLAASTTPSAIAATALPTSHAAALAAAQAANAAASSASSADAAIAASAISTSATSALPTSATSALPTSATSTLPTTATHTPTPSAPPPPSPQDVTLRLAAARNKLLRGHQYGHPPLNGHRPLNGIRCAGLGKELAMDLTEQGRVWSVSPALRALFHEGVCNLRRSPPPDGLP